MATKALTAKVKLNISDAESKLSQLKKKIDQLNSAANKVGSSATSLEKGLERTSRQSDKLASNLNKATSNANKTASAANKINGKTASATTQANRLADGYKKAAHHSSILTKNLRALISTYVGVMGAKAVLGASDTITSAENRLNYANASQMGNQGYVTDANGNKGYSQAVLNATQSSMDKMYASSQKVRTSYADMMATVSKSMALAGDAFNNNTDNAIRFQEVMAETYALGGASAAEMASSMYQLTQALGSGILQGDELRSVREGAPLAYKAIEEFAQGVYGADESLKDLAAQGKITSDMVVAAMLSAGEEIDAAFEAMPMTFGQAFNKIKNSAFKSFEPVLQLLNDGLNSDAGQAAINGLTSAIGTLANVVYVVLQAFGMFFTWCYENWNWLKYVVIGVISAIVIWLGYMAANAVFAFGAWLVNAIATRWQMILILGILGALVAALVWVFNTAQTGCEAIIMSLSLIALALVLIGIVIGNIWLIFAGVIVAMAAAALMFVSEMMGYAYWVKAGISNILNYLKFLFFAVCAYCGTVWDNLCAGFMATITAFGALFDAACNNMSISWNWLCDKIKFYFADAINGCIDMLNGLIGGLPAGMLEFLGISKIEHVNAGDPGNAPATKDLSDAYHKAWNDYYDARYKDPSQAFNDKMSEYDAVHKDLDTAYQEGYQKGEAIKSAINEWYAKLKDKVSTGLPISGSPGNTTAELTPDDIGALLDNINKTLGDGDDGVSGDTKKLAESVELAEEDLKLLRQLAEQEWKKEYTTASVVVNMNNTNTINNQGDLDGWVTVLAEKLNDELNAVADGVYV